MTKASRKIIITISGFHGVGKSVFSRTIAKYFGLRRLSAGEIFRKMAEKRGITIEELSKIALHTGEIDREIDNYIVREAEKGGVVIDSLLAGWMLRDKAHIKVFLTAPFEERVKRIAKRDGKSLDEAYRETRMREDSERERFKKYYGINIDDLSIYQVVIDTTIGDIESIKDALIDLVKGYLRTHEL